MAVGDSVRVGRGGPAPAPPAAIMEVQQLLYTPVLSPDSVPPKYVAGLFAVSCFVRRARVLGWRRSASAFKTVLGSDSDCLYVCVCVCVCVPLSVWRTNHAPTRRNYPPAFSARKLGGLCCVFAVTVLFAEARGLLLPVAVGDAGVWSHAARCFDLAVLVTAGFVYVSRVTLGREGWCGSRYTTAAFSCEFVKVLATVPVWYAVSSREALAALCPPAGMSSASVVCAGSLPVLEYVLPFLVGIHFVYLDNSEFLQRFGCKWPVAAAWPSMTASELAFGGGVLLGIGAYSRAQLGEVLAASADARLQLAMVYGTAVVAFAVTTARLRATHHVHFHHYLSGALLLPLACFPTRLSSVVGGLCLAVFTEGCAVWGMDPIWVRTPAGE